MARQPLLMMRTRGLSGPLFARHHGVPGLSKSTSNRLGNLNPQPGPGPGDDIVQEVAAQLVLEGWTIVGFVPDQQFTVQDEGHLVTKQDIETCNTAGMSGPLTVDFRQAVQNVGVACP